MGFKGRCEEEMATAPVVTTVDMATAVATVVDMVMVEVTTVATVALSLHNTAMTMGMAVDTATVVTATVATATGVATVRIMAIMATVDTQNTVIKRGTRSLSIYLSIYLLYAFNISHSPTSPHPKIQDIMLLFHKEIKQSSNHVCHVSYVVQLYRYIYFNISN